MILAGLPETRFPRSVLRPGVFTGEWMSERIPPSNQVSPDQATELMNSSAVDGAAQAPRVRTILAVDDNPEGLFALEATLSAAGYRVVTATSGEEALAVARSERPDLILLDVNMPKPDGYAVTRELKADPELRFSTIVLLTARGSLDDVVYGLAQGADDHIKKPFDREELLARVAAALRVRSLYEELRSSSKERTRLQRRAEETSSYANIIGASQAMRAVFDLLDKVKDAEVPVLITGESGTGKELIASALHFQSVRKSKPFIIQNCAALQEQLLESELFGHVKGSFTGAIRDKEGLFEAADQGTLFLDEVGEMSPQLQAKLLRVLQDGTFTPVGSTSSRRAKVRVVAATHRDLKDMVSKGTFRQDLYYRLNVVPVRLPSLRERQTDIPLLVEFFLKSKRKGAAASKTHVSFSPSAIAALVRYSWPGNVRELQTEIERVLLLSGGANPILPEHLSISEQAVSNGIGSQSGSSGASERTEQHSTGETSGLKDALSALECRLIKEALENTKGNKSEAARVLGISRSNLIAKVQEYHLED